MPIKHLLLALLVVVAWGLNFIFVKFALDEISPLFLCALRFLLASIPAIFFIKPPATKFSLVVTYGLVMFALQFALVFMGLYVGMTPGMASILMQVQVFFSMFFAALILGEIPTPWQVLGAVISFSGIGLVALHFDSHISLAGFIFIMGAAATWGVGNLITKKIGHVNMISLVVWGSFAASFPMLVLSFLFEGKTMIAQDIHHITWFGVLSVAYIVYASTWVGYGVWNWLLSRYPVSTIVPFTLLVPIVGVLSSVIFIGEPFQPWKMLAGLLVVTGLFINILGPKLFKKKDYLLETEVS